ncbi:putative nuclease HARBI1 [Rhodamnia argentea]|uniref:Nuclease HARBI1 n=1 Tax=Rhodamnia argentea TaxID=178133 RepID=A0ABM3GSF7_9MYRT|nr:putative nuclease HARBI1 [Rhodamnia argentea]
MTTRGWLKDSRYVRVDEQLGIFLSLVGHGNSNRYLCERFQRSGQTISTYFSIVLKAFLKLAKEIIGPPSFDDIPEEIPMDPNHQCYFKGCVSAIDGTHINASVSASKQIPYRGGKGITTQNVLYVCSFDMKFTFVYAGWEGSVNDCRVLSAALDTPRLQFPRPPPGKYYVVDSGYAALPGFLTPFKGERYHPNDYRGKGRRPRTAKEMFNRRHSSLRNVIERSFGALKNRFTILRRMPPFKVRKQAYIVIACCALHNYIRDQDRMDRNFSRYGDPEYPCGPIQEEVADDISHEGATEINMLRKSIANKMARDNNMAEIP